MKKVFISTIVILAAFSAVSAQIAPSGAGDSDLRDTNIKGRSNELERIDRDARKETSKKKNKSKVNQAAEQPPAEDKLAAKFAEIKTDYEQIQLLHDSIIKAYNVDGKIDYAQIGKSSAEINKSAVRLNSNLFPDSPAKTPPAGKVESSNSAKDEKTDKNPQQPKSVRDLIVDLGDNINSFATSPMFQNLRAVDPAVSEKAKSDLDKIIEESALLNTEAEKMAAEK